MKRLERIWAACLGGPSGSPRLAVLIDGDGVSPKDAERALDWLEHRGRVCVLRSYGNYAGGTASAAWTGLIKRRGIVARHLPNVSRGKNATDIALTVDAVELLLTRPVDIFVLIVSDADFVPLVHRMREQGNTVIGIGQHSTAEPFRRACSEFHEVRMLGRHIASAPPNAQLWSLNPSDAEELVLSVLGELCADWRPVTLSLLGARLIERDPAFDTRVYGRRTLRALISAMPSVELVEHEGKYHVVPANGRTGTG